MRCSGCGKRIPSDGNVCPYCLRDKKADRDANSAATFFAVIGGGIGYAINGFAGLLVGGAICAFIGGIVLALGAGKRGKEPPAVRVAHDISTPSQRSVTPTPLPEVDHATRLKRLDKLRANGMITDAEYAERRAVVVSSL